MISLTSMYIKKSTAMMLRRVASLTVRFVEESRVAWTLSNLLSNLASRRLETTWDVAQIEKADMPSIIVMEFDPNSRSCVWEGPTRSLKTHLGPFLCAGLPLEMRGSEQVGSGQCAKMI